MAGMATQIILDFDKKPDVQPRPQKFAEENIVSYAVSPLVEQGRGIGVLEVFNRSRLHIDEEWVNYFETIAGQTGIAIHTADLISEVQKGKQDLEVAYDATLEGWVRALDMRDNETEGHTQRVTHLTLKLARRMGKFSATELQDIYRGALLHDIGKMAVPDEILHKPGPLNDAEWAIMRDHTTFARNFLEPIDYLREAMAIPYNHHEKWDGSGYPQGLVGEAIPLVARIFAVVDVYDALTSDRPYRKALPVQEVLAYIEDNTGSHFEPEVVVEFLAMMRELDDLPA
jgi:putative nucleotidyltransferase with HDIG domain